MGFHPTLRSPEITYTNLLSWAKVGKGGTIPPGNQWVVKNSFECKSCLRVLFDGNVIENVLGQRVN